jgi:ATP-dependent RNA helicase SUPV3L1/SUV3
MKQWINDKTMRRLVSYGVPRDEGSELLSLFQECSHSQSLPSVDQYDTQTLTHLSSALTDVTQGSTIERTISRIFFDWVLIPQFRSLYGTFVSQFTLDSLRNLRAITDFPHPAEQYPRARTINRKIIMHVGPTNSGKTHHALRALAAAKSGVYAGPLRLLAHEIWERLNKGQIIPLGVDLDKDAEVDSSSGIDIMDGSSEAAPIVTKQKNPSYARPCNLLTGEEQRTVAIDALLSCTVEMLPFDHKFDVAVVDEIQMIADPGRGSGWTSAVLGLCAAEIHLCGEETAVPIVKKLVEQTGDELVVNLHQRLTPLQPADKSLDGDYGNIREGDCVVAFSRSEIYSIKSKIERSTGLRCAVAYGRLPPEIRSEQAALFNDPSSGYDVMVGSDALGMGLNLCVRSAQFS